MTQKSTMPPASTRPHAAGTRPSYRSGGEVPATVHDVLREPGQPLDASARAYFEPRFGADFGATRSIRPDALTVGDASAAAETDAEAVARGDRRPSGVVDLNAVQVHTGERADAAGTALGAAAFTVGSHVVLTDAVRTRTGAVGRRVLAHELAHMAAGHDCGGTVIRRYGTPIPDVANPSVKTMREFIDLVKRVEAGNSGLDPLQVAQKIMRTKYHESGWDYLLPSSAKGQQVTAGGGVTVDDVTTLGGEFEVTLPQGGRSDPSHVVVAVVADAERQQPGAGGSAGLSGRLVTTPPAGLSQRDITTWVGDVASAAVEWETAHPHPKGGNTKQNYLDEFAPESDLIGDVDGVAMASRTAAQGFVFDPAATLSSNLERFYFPANPREGKNRRFHTFCAVEGLTLEPDGVTLTAAALADVQRRVRLNTDWFRQNDPNLLSWMALNAGSGRGDLSNLFNPVLKQWIARANDWTWFVDRFVDCVQRNLRAEGL